MPNANTNAAVKVADGASAPILRLPETGFLRQSQVLSFVPISKSTLWRRVQERTFPEPVKLSERVTAWRAEDIRVWIDVQTRGDAGAAGAWAQKPVSAVAGRRGP